MERFLAGTGGISQRTVIIHNQRLCLRLIIQRETSRKWLCFLLFDFASITIAMMFTKGMKRKKAWVGNCLIHKSDKYHPSKPRSIHVPARVSKTRNVTQILRIPAAGACLKGIRLDYAKKA